MFAQRAALSIIACVSLVILSAGCGAATVPNTGVPASSPPVGNPRSALAPAASALRDGNFAFTIANVRGKGKGVVHQPSGTASMEHTTNGVGMTKQFAGSVLIGHDYYVKFSFIDDDNEWEHYDVRSPGVPDRGPDGDFTSVIDLLGSVTTEKVSGRTVTGTMDLAKLKSLMLFNPLSFERLGRHARALPFTATLDADARLTKLVMHSPAVGERTADDLILTFTGYGEQRAQQKPVGTIIEA